MTNSNLAQHISQVEEPRTAARLAAELDPDASEYNGGIVDAARELVQSERGAAVYVTGGPAGTVWQFEGEFITLPHKGGV